MINRNSEHRFCDRCGVATDGLLPLLERVVHLLNEGQTVLAIEEEARMAKTFYSYDLPSVCVFYESEHLIVFGSLLNATERMHRAFSIAHVNTTFPSRLIDNMMWHNGSLVPLRSVSIT